MKKIEYIIKGETFGNVVLIITNQTHRYTEFSDGELFFRSSNGIILQSLSYPDFNHNTLYVRGTDVQYDTLEVLIPSNKISEVLFALEEYNTTFSNNYDIDRYKKKQLQALKECIDHWKRMCQYAARKASEGEYNACVMQNELRETPSSDSCALCRLNEGNCSLCVLYLNGLDCNSSDSLYNKAVNSSTWGEFKSRAKDFVNAMYTLLLKKRYCSEEETKDKVEEKEKERIPLTTAELVHEVKKRVGEFSISELIAIATKVHGVMYKALRSEK